MHHWVYILSAVPCGLGNDVQKPKACQVRLRPVAACLDSSICDLTDIRRGHVMSDPARMILVISALTSCSVVGWTNDTKAGSDV
jgi:hypothetical protein